MKMGDYVRIRDYDGSEMFGHVTDIMQWPAVDYQVTDSQGRKAIYKLSQLELVGEIAALFKACDCGGWTAGTHSAWCSNPEDNAIRQKGLARK